MACQTDLKCINRAWYSGALLAFFNGKAEAGGLLRVRGQLGLQNKSLSQKKKKNTHIDTCMHIRKRLSLFSYQVDISCLGTQGELVGKGSR